MKQNGRFRHESLQDRSSIQDLLNALNEGMARGKLVLENEDGKLELNPADLVNLRISATADEDRNRLDIRISWQGEREVPKGKKIPLKSD
ncbi:amphi-Trp domain-containing protein [Aestuariispira insulae]|uniref:Amphi-Trp domain-containing protein n=1 Tax=Aestuariispira insulae TaxID=1461337 RepID=A0A3D9H8K8_9PROT|nr:amphi-Trp domain-containing protein [Aestuariispira insulae]RED45807.1 amphi-Trp domain-containing protein [Aestuariispira insulae]